jgi:hypothetical protein
VSSARAAREQRSGGAAERRSGRRALGGAWGGGPESISTTHAASVYVSKTRMVALSRLWILSQGSYALFLFFPVTAFALLALEPWKDRVLCDQQEPTKICVCRAEFPVFASLVIGLELVIYCLLAWHNPIMHANGRNTLEKRSRASYARWIGLGVYYLTYIISLFYLMQSNEQCGEAVSFFTVITAFFRGPLVCIFVALYEKEGDAADGAAVAEFTV